MGQNLYKVGKAFEDLSDLDQYVKIIHKVREQPRGDEEMVKAEEELCLGYSKTNVAGFMSSWSF